MNPKTETRILAAYGAARALADVVDGHSTLVVEVRLKLVDCRAFRFGCECAWAAPLSDRDDEQNWGRLAMVLEDVLDMLKVTTRP